MTARRRTTKPDAGRSEVALGMREFDGVAILYPVSSIVQFHMTVLNPDTDAARSVAVDSPRPTVAEFAMIMWGERQGHG